MRKICVVTGSRSEYGLIKPLLKRIKSHSELELELVVTGMHLEKEYGNSLDHIKNDGFKIAIEIPIGPFFGDELSVTKSIGLEIVNLSSFLKESNPDILLVMGDRSEALGAAISAAYLNIPIAHLSGGDSARAGVDESARHAISKFSSIHFPATELSKQRLLKMGEDKWRITLSGEPGIDTIVHSDFLTKKKLSEKLKVSIETDYILLIQHSVSTEPEKSKSQIHETVLALKEIGMKTIFIYPNSDAGGFQIIKYLEDLRDDKMFFGFDNLPHLEYLTLLKYCSLIVGNSSSGIVESSSFKVPAVNIGIRQDSRERSSNVIDAPHSCDEIVNAIKLGLSDDFKNSIQKIVNPYGQGNASEIICRKLANIEITEKLIQKKLTY